MSIRANGHSQHFIMEKGSIQQHTKYLVGFYDASEHTFYQCTLADVYSGNVKHRKAFRNNGGNFEQGYYILEVIEVLNFGTVLGIEAMPVCEISHRTLTNSVIRHIFSASCLFPGDEHAQSAKHLRISELEMRLNRSHYGERIPQEKPFAEYSRLICANAVEQLVHGYIAPQDLAWVATNDYTERDERFLLGVQAEGLFDALRMHLVTNRRPASAFGCPHLAKWYFKRLVARIEKDEYCMVAERDIDVWEMSVLVPELLEFSKMYSQLVKYHDNHEVDTMNVCDAIISGSIWVRIEKVLAFSENCEK